MEVHAHTHTPPDPGSHRGRKKWTHYLWEFLMLFLAVFCGFLAEYKLEHMIEHQREKQYMVTMLEDLKSDTTLLKVSINYWTDVNSSIDSLADAIQFPSSRTDLPKAYRHLNNALNYFSFMYNDRTISQLKNSGGFRLINKKIVANKIIQYDQFNNDARKNIAAQYNKFYENVVQIRNRVFQQELINKIYEKYHYVPPPASVDPWIINELNKTPLPFSNEESAKAMYEFKNALLAYRKDFSNTEWANTQTILFSKELIKLIKENYHLN